MDQAAQATGRILLVDTEEATLRTVRHCLEREGYQVATANNSTQVFSLLKRQVFDLCFLDLLLDGECGYTLLAQMHALTPWMRVVILTADSTVDNAVEAIQSGAVDYLVKPCNVDMVRQSAAAQMAARRKAAPLESPLQQPGKNLHSQNPAMVAMVETARRVAATDANVLILGESGTGKGELARLIHHWSKRAANSLVTINCPSLNTELMESELFGHSRGAFTGACTNTFGRVSQADGGTLFLDEIGDFPLSLQPKLLRFIQDKEYERVGDPLTYRANVRILSATNLDLARMADSGRFREDLLYRLNVITLSLPPLRERAEDIGALADGFLARFAGEYNCPALGFSEEARSALLAYPWPGNIRELSNVIERASIICTDEMVEPRHLGFSEQPYSNAARVGSDISLEELEKAHISAILATTSTLDKAARILSIDASTLYRKRKQFGL